MHTTLGSVYAYKSELDAWWSSRPSAGESAPGLEETRSIAVLPFADLDRDLDTEILADGLTEELINTLAQVEGLRVVAHTSVYQFKGRETDVREIAARLGVDTVLEGSLRRAGERVRVVVQLIDGHSGCHLWSERFDHERKDLFGVQEDIAHAIASTLRTSLAGGSLAIPPAMPYRGNIDTYERYLEGRYHWNRRTPAGFLKAVDCFERVLSEDPGLAVAWAALADCYAMAQGFSTMPPAETIGKAREAAEKALALDPALAEAHVTLGFMASAYAFDWAQAETHFLRALELKPDLAFAHLLYSVVMLAPAGRLDEASVHQTLASELDPLSPMIANAAGMLRLMQRQYDSAAAAFLAALALDPAYPWAHRGLGQVYLLQGRYADASVALASIEMPALAAGYLGYCQARLGNLELAHRTLRRLEQSDQPAVSYQVAVLRLGLGDFNGCFESLSRAVDHRSIGVFWLKVEPLWDPLRADPRFASLLASMGLGVQPPDVT